MGVLAHRLRIDTSGNFQAHMSAESPSNTSPNPFEVISEVLEPLDAFVSVVSLNVIKRTQLARIRRWALSVGDEVTKWVTSCPYSRIFYGIQYGLLLVVGRSFLYSCYLVIRVFIHQSFKVTRAQVSVHIGCFRTGVPHQCLCHMFAVTVSGMSPECMT